MASPTAGPPPAIVPPAAVTDAPPVEPSQPATATPPATVAPPTAVTAPATVTPPTAEAGPAERPPVGRLAPVRRSRRLVGTLIFGAVVVLLVAAIGYLVYQRFYADPTRNATAGDCLADLPIVANDEDREVGAGRIVPCSDPGATYVVEGRLDRLTEEQATSPTICQAYENAGFVYRVVPRGGTGYVLCLRPLDT